MSVVTRFAPSPTGWLHVGHARAAAEAFGFAREQDGTCLLRVEDIDHTRCRPEYTDGIFEDLRWLGFDWPDTVRVQSAHRNAYAKVAERLRDMGVIYPCALSRKEVAARAVDGVFRGAELAGSGKTDQGDIPWRLDVERAREMTGPIAYLDNGERVAVAFDRVSDEVVVRRDIGTSYAIACAHDDHVQGITHVVRGEDLRDATPAQVILQRLLGWASPAYLHHGLVMDGERKLSKRDGSVAVRDLRASGVSAEAVLGMGGVAN